MTREEKADVLVVGAGPVGMLTALRLAGQKIETLVVDKESRPATHSYACVLHPATLRLLDQMGIAESVLPEGRRLETVAFYDGNQRQSEVRLSALGGKFPFALVLPQNSLEGLLAARLKQSPHVQLLWNHRVTNLEFAPREVVAGIDKLKQSAKGYIVADWDWTVQKSFQSKAAFVVGADGHNSMVRSRLKIDYPLLAPPASFAVFEFETDADPGNEVRVVLDENSTNVLWPLPGNRCRWSFQLNKVKEAGDFPEKDREVWPFPLEDVDQTTRTRLDKLIANRAPWFQQKIKLVNWWTRIHFGHSLATQFGSKLGWLVGDAAHQIGPVGAQSMNIGFLEATDLAQSLGKVLNQGAGHAVLENYSRTRHAKWESLLGISTGPQARPGADAWTRAHQRTIPYCLPASGDDLAQLLGQVGIEWQDQNVKTAA